MAEFQVYRGLPAEKGTAETKIRSYLFDDVVVDCESLRVQKGGVPHKITPRAFEVLVYLAEHCGRIVEKQELFDQVWKEKFVTDNALTRVIKEIRQVIGDDADSPRYIETVHKRGYRFIADVKVEQETGAPTEHATASAWQQPIAAQAEPLIVAETDTGLLTSQGGTSVPATAASMAEFPINWIKQRKVVAVVVALWLLALAGLGSYLLLKPQPPVGSLAVLPLKNLTGDPANEFFSDGLTESLITALSKIRDPKIGDLKVISSSSIFRFKGRQVDPREVGRQFGVAAVLEGSVRKGANSVRVEVRLVSVEDGRVLWARDTYEQALGDIFALQDEVVQKVVAGLRLKLRHEGKQRLAKPYTDNIEAYQAYMKGRYFWNKRTAEDLKKAIEYFEQAIKMDPGYALAYAGLADSYSLINFYGGPYQQKMAFEKARAAAEKALEIDEELAEAHTALGYVKKSYELDWPGAENQFKRALELNPNYATAHQLYSEYLALMGRIEESLLHVRRAYELDPFSLIINTNLGYPYLCARQYDQAMKEFQKALEMDPNFPLALYYLARCYEHKSMFEEAIAAYRKAISISGGSTVMIAGLAHCYAASGRRPEARGVLTELIASSKQHHISPYAIAIIHIGLGSKDQAIAWLEKAHEERDDLLIMIKVDPRLDSLRSDPRFIQLLQEMGFGGVKKSVPRA